MKEFQFSLSESPLPPQCFSVLPSTGELIIIERGEQGYSVSPVAHFKGKTPQQSADVLNGNMGVTKAQEAAMLGGATQGWATPAADPKNYDEKGRPIKPKPKRRDRGDAR